MSNPNRSLLLIVFFVPVNLDSLPYFLSAAMARKVKASSSSSDFSCSYWASLPKDLLGLILDKIVPVSEYIMFCSVCKSWYSIGFKNKEKQMRLRSNNHQLPWLLLRSYKSGDCYLYNLFTAKILSFRLRIPPLFNNQTCMGSSHGWLFFKDEGDRSLIAANPLSSATIRLPPFNATEYGKIRMIGSRVVVKLSRDPCLGSFEVVVTPISGLAVVAHLEYGDGFWTYSKKMEAPLKALTFYKGRILGATKLGDIVSLDVISGEGIEIREEVVAPPVLLEGFSNDGCGCFVEATNGDLLMVCTREQQMAKEDAFKIYKLKIDCSNKQIECVPIQNLGGDSLFLGDTYRDHTAVSVLPSNYPECRPNSIYYAHSKYYNLSEIDAFNLEDGSVSQTRLPEGFFKECLSSWVVPSMTLVCN